MIRLWPIFFGGCSFYYFLVLLILFIHSLLALEYAFFGPKIIFLLCLTDEKSFWTIYYCYK